MLLGRRTRLHAMQGPVASAVIERAILSATCPYCDAQIPMRAEINRDNPEHLALSFTTNAIRAHVWISHPERRAECG